MAITSSFNLSLSILTSSNDDVKFLILVQSTCGKTSSSHSQKPHEIGRHIIQKDHLVNHYKASLVDSKLQ